VCLQMADQVTAFHLVREDQRLTDHVFSFDGLLGESPIGFEHEFDSLGQVGTGFLERTRLSVGARQFLDEPDIALGDFLKHGSEFHRDTKLNGERREYSGASTWDAQRSQ